MRKNDLKESMGQKNKKKPLPEYNVWRVLYVLVEGILNLINNNKIYPAFGLFILSIICLIIWRLPETDLADIIKLLINEVIVGKSGLIFIIIFTNFGWVYVFNRMKVIYGHEIDRLASLRSELMHRPERNNIEEHRSTNGDCEESYMVPSKKEEKQ